MRPILAFLILGIACVLLTKLVEDKWPQKEIIIIGGMYRIDCDSIVNWYSDGTERKSYSPMRPCPGWVDEYGTRDLIGPGIEISVAPPKPKE